jgi:hypothetical protein
MGLAELRAQSVRIELRRVRLAWDLDMILAAVFLLGTLWTTAAPLAAAPQSAPLSQPANTPPGAAEPETQGTATPAQNAPTSSQPQTATTKPPSAAKRRRRTKKVASCGTAASASPAASGSTPPVAERNPSPSGTPGPEQPCPAPKVIVQHGGTSEPSIQLGGSAGSETPDKRNTANQMLGTTDANLKQIAGRQLSATQQDMVNQIRQFMDQSKAAVVDGDLERARTLAWKAQVLSEELVKAP